MGPYGCVGKYLAIVEIQIFIARIMSQREISFPDGKDAVIGLDNRGMLNCTKRAVTLLPPDVNLRLKSKTG